MRYTCELFILLLVTLTAYFTLSGPAPVVLHVNVAGSP